MKKQEGEWERVQRRRKEGKCLGGHYRHWDRSGDLTYLANQQKYEKKKIGANFYQRFHQKIEVES